jgi:hypothetical protein
MRNHQHSQFHSITSSSEETPYALTVTLIHATKPQHLVDN